jgi:hypothetical protein
LYVEILRYIHHISVIGELWVSKLVELRWAQRGSSLVEKHETTMDQRDLAGLANTIAVYV